MPDSIICFVFSISLNGSAIHANIEPDFILVKSGTPILVTKSEPSTSSELDIDAPFAS